MIRLDRSPRRAAPAAVERRLVRTLEQARGRAGAVLASDYGSGTIGAAAIEALRRLHPPGVPVCVDSRYNPAGVHRPTMVKPNEVELQAASGVSLAGRGASTARRGPCSAASGARCSS